MEAAHVTLKRGSLYLDRRLCEAWFSGLEAVVLLRRDDDLLILPVKHAAAGGYILKWRNKAGDRVVHAPEFFRSHGLDDTAERDLPVAWAEEGACVLAHNTFAHSTFK